MATQFDHLVDDQLLERLSRKERPAEVKLAQCYNKGRPKKERMDVSSQGAA